MSKKRTRKSKINAKSRLKSKIRKNQPAAAVTKNAVTKNSAKHVAEVEVNTDQNPYFVKDMRRSLLATLTITLLLILAWIWLS